MYICFVSLAFIGQFVKFGSFSNMSSQTLRSLLINTARSALSFAISADGEITLDPVSPLPLALVLLGFLQFLTAALIIKLILLKNPRKLAITRLMLAWLCLDASEICNPNQKPSAKWDQIGTGDTPS